MRYVDLKGCCVHFGLGGFDVDTVFESAFLVLKAWKGVSIQIVNSGLEIVDLNVYLISLGYGLL